MEARDNLVPVSMGEMLSTCPPLNRSPDPAMVPIAITWTGSSDEEGWPRHQEEIAKHPQLERTGWLINEPFLEQPPPLHQLRMLRDLSMNLGQTRSLPQRLHRFTENIHDLIDLCVACDKRRSETIDIAT